MQRSSEAISASPPTRNANWTTQCLLARNKRAKPASDQERERIFAKEGLYLSGDLLTLL